MSRSPVSRLLVSLLSLTCLATLLILNRLTLLQTREAIAASAPGYQSEVVYVPDTRTLRLMFLGYDQAAADMMWLRTLEYFGRHLATDRQYPWLEFFLDQIIEFDPRFQGVYHWAGANVLYGARFTNANVRSSNRFYELALKRDPEDYEAAYRLGINYYIEMKSDDEEEKRRFEELGVQYLEMAANMPGAPSKLRNLVASLYRKLGKQDLAIQNLIELIEDTEDPDQRENLQARLRSVAGDVDVSTLLAENEAFERAWRTRYPYLPAGLFLLLGDIERPVPDVDWHTLLPDVTAGAETPVAETP